MLAEIEAEQKAVAAAEDGIAARLARLRGIGVTLPPSSNEVFVRDLRNRREVGAYLGLARARGRAARSNATRASPSRQSAARLTAIELAWLWLRHQPGSVLARWFRERVAGAKGRMRRIMPLPWRGVDHRVVALRDHGTVPEGAVLKV